MTWQIRQAVSADMDAVKEVFRTSALSNEGNRDNLLAHPEALEFTDLSVVEGRTRVAIDGDRVVGFATYAVGSRMLDLDDLFVHPDWMGRGVGRALLADVIAIARGRGITRVEVTANEHALGFYQKAGFVYDRNVYTRFGPAPRMHLDILPA